MNKRISFGPDPRQSFSHQELPIGSTMVGQDPETAKTGRWRFYRPVFVWGIAPCQEACPAGVDVRGFISILRKKDFEQAWLKYVQENPFPAICGRICPHPCEVSCNRRDLDSAVSIRALERFISDFRKPLSQISDAGRARIKVGIAGGGPAGLSCAFFLSRLGYQPTLIEREKDVGGTLRQTPECYLPEGLIEQEIKAIIEDVTVQRKEWRWEDLERFEAVYLAPGLASLNTVDGRIPPVKIEGGRIWVDSSCATDRRGFFAGGGAVRGVQSVVEAIGDGKRGAIAIDTYLQGKSFCEDLGELLIGGKGALSFERYRTGKIEGESLKRVVSYPDLNSSVLNRKQRVEASHQRLETEPGKFEEVELTLASHEAIEEASRCLDCGSCNRCGRCVLYCPEGAVSPGSRSSRAMEIDYDYCKGCGICRNECPKGMFAFKKEEADWE